MRTRMSRKAQNWVATVTRVRFYCGGCGAPLSEISGKLAKEFAANPELVRIKEHGLEHGHSRVCELYLINHEFVTGR